MADQDYTYRPATRGNAATLTMFSGPSGTGKTYSALKFARGLAGPDGKICVADTEHGRALYYADEFKFDHLELTEPFRPEKFETAAIAAQQQGAAVLLIDSFSHEHTGPGGLLDYFEDEMQRLLEIAKKQERNRNASEWELRNAQNFTAWHKPKAAHKHMLQRLWQLNCHIILCCMADKKIELVKNPQKGNRTEPKDRGLQPICGGDIPYAMTMSFLFASIEKPGVPTVIKPLLPALRPLIDLSQPIDEAFGSRIAAWARGEKSTPSTTNEAAKSNAPSPPPPATDDGGARVAAKIQELAALFAATTSLSEHMALVADGSDTMKSIEWLKKQRKAEYLRDLDPFIRDSFARHNKPPSDQPQQEQQA